MIEEFVRNHSNSIIGILGTLLGVVVGAIINQISRSGRLKIYPKTVNIEIHKQDMYGDFIAQEKIDSDTNSVSIYFSLDLQNSSSEQKNGRDIFLVIRKDGNEIKSIINELSTLTHTNHSLHVNRIENINIPAKTIESLKLSSKLDKDNFSFIENSTFYLEFKDSKNRLRRIKLKHE